MGSVTPLLAVIPLLQQHGHEIFFVGTPRGPEGELVRLRNIPFTTLVAPKLRRYFSLRTVFFPFELLLGLMQAVRILLQWKPDVMVTAGGYVAVPLGWVGWVLRVPLVVHQQDIKPGMANILLQPMATKMTVSLHESLAFFPKAKTQWIGNPVRNLTPTTSSFALDATVPTVLIMGGGTGAAAINNLVHEELCAYANVLHLTGKGKSGPAILHPRYHVFPFLDEELPEAYAKADVVVGRAGLGTMSELSALGKAAIIIPLPRTHQKANAQLLQRKNAAIVLAQKKLTPQLFTQEVHQLLTSPRRRDQLAINIRKLMPAHAAADFAATIEGIQ